jgi:hypothetical protein
VLKDGEELMDHGEELMDHGEVVACMSGSESSAVFSEGLSGTYDRRHLRDLVTHANN